MMMMVMMMLTMLMMMMMINNNHNTKHYNTGHDNASTSASARLVDEMDGWVDLYKDRSIDGYIGEVYAGES